jgi:hypothetical protein
MRRTSLHRPARLAALALAAGLALSGCGPAELGAAAVVDGQSVTVRDLQSSTRQYLAAVPDSQSGEVQRGILQQLIVLRVIDRAARTAHVDVTRGEVASQRDQLFASVRPQARQAKVSPRTFVVRELARSQQPTVVAPNHLDLWIRGQILANKITAATTADDGAAAQSAFVQAAKKTHIKVNPRYGRWDPQRGLAPLVSGDLSRTADQLNQRAAGK